MNTEQSSLAVAIYNEKTNAIDLRVYYEPDGKETPDQAELDRALAEALRKYREENTQKATEPF